MNKNVYVSDFDQIKLINYHVQTDGRIWIPVRPNHSGIPEPSESVNIEGQNLHQLETFSQNQPFYFKSDNSSLITGN